MALKQLRQARLALQSASAARAQKLAPKSERYRRDTIHAVERDPDVKTVAPVVAHKLFGQSTADGLSAAQRRQVREFSVSVVKALRDAGRLQPKEAMA